MQSSAGEAHEYSLPKPSSLPKFAAVRRLAEALEGRGHNGDAASAIANAVVDPSLVRRLLETPVEMRVPGGALQVVYTRVWAPSLTVFPSNARVLPNLTYPSSGNAGRSPMTPPRPDARGAPQLHLEVDGPEKLLGTLDAIVGHLESANPLADSIRQEGVREALTLVPLTLTFADEPPVTVLSAADGSSRVAGLYRALDLTSQEVIFRLSASGKALRQRVARVLALSTVDDDELSDEEQGRLRAVEVPAAIIVGLRVEGGTTDIARAVDARVANIHVTPPLPWPEPARLDAQLNAAIRTFEDRGSYEADYLLYLAGHLTPKQAQRAGYSSDLDSRAAEVLSVLLARANTSVINRALRGLSIPKPTPKDRARIAAEAALRPIRSELSRSAVEAARNLLQAVYAMEEFRLASWRVDSAIDPDDLLDLALEEAPDGAGAATLQLAAAAFFWMAYRGVVRRTTRGGEEDRRDITSVLRLMLTSEHGLRTLHRVVVDCRAGERPMRISPRGRYVVNSKRERRPIDEQWIRKTWSSGSTAPTKTMRATPEADLAQRRAELRDTAVDLSLQVEGLLEPKAPNGAPLVLVDGIPVSYAKEITDALIDANAALSHYAYVSKMRLADTKDTTADTTMRL